MRIRSIPTLQTKLDEEFAWRLKEVDFFKTQVRTSPDVTRATYIRAGIALLYAHWEGFIKNTSQAYLSFVASRSLTYDKLHASFVLRGMRRELRGDGIFSTKDILFFRKRFGTRANLPRDGKISAKSNLNQEVFREILDSIGLDPRKFTGSLDSIDDPLLRLRNLIAHGDHEPMSSDSFLLLSDEVIAVMRLYKTEIQNAATLGTFRV